MQDYEESVSFLGTWGVFQKKVFFLLCFTVVPSGYIALSVIFLLAIPPHHCHIPVQRNLSEEWMQASIPLQLVAGQLERSSCSRYQLDAVQNLSVMETPSSLDRGQNLSVPGAGPGVSFLELKQEGCNDGWTYSTQYYQSTVVTEFNMVCSDQWRQPLTSLFYFLGGLFGCFISGQMADRYGRKPVLFCAILVLSVFSTAVAFAPSWPVFTVLFFVLGMGQISSYIIVFVLGTEILTGSTRVLFSSMCLPIFYVTSTMLLPCTAYVVRSWRHLSLIMAVPGLACIPLWWLVPESPRWLVSRGRVKEAEDLLRSAALQNRVATPDVIFPSANDEKTSEQKIQTLSFLDLLRTTNIRYVTLKLWLIWFAWSVTYFGLSFNASSLSGNPFLNYVLLTAAEIPAYPCSWVAARSLPRRLSFTCFTLLGALALLLVQVTLHSNPAATLCLVLLGKFGIIAGSGVLYMYTGELSPTVIRNTAMSSCAMFSRVGSALSPYLLQLAVFYLFLPWIVVGSLALLSVLLCLLLPETFRQPLPDTIQQMAHTERFRWPWNSILPPEAERKLAEVQRTTAKLICTTRL